MARLRLHLRTNPETGRRDLVIDYESDPSALPVEHENQHRDLVDRLIAGGALRAGELGEIIVERLPEQRLGTSTSTDPREPTPQPEEHGRERQ